MVMLQEQVTVQAGDAKNYKKNECVLIRCSLIGLQYSHAVLQEYFIFLAMSRQGRPKW